MEMIAVTASPFLAYHNSDGFGRFIVVFLFVLSVISWTLMIDKWLYLRTIKKQLDDFFSVFSKSTSPLELFFRLDILKGPMKAVTSSGLAVIVQITRKTSQELLAEMRNNRPQLSPLDSELVQVGLERTLDDEIVEMEQHLVFLGSIVSLSPFLGLLGTVWGVLMAFLDMAIKGKADINTLAPGVSGALLTTVAGLLVAIPTLFGYNLLTNSVQLLSARCDHLTCELSARLKQFFVQKTD